MSPSSASDPDIRRTGFGGSDAAAVVGVSRYRTPHDVYLEKLGLTAPLIESEAMEWGKRLEPVVLAKYVEVTGRKITKGGRTIRHPKLPFMYAHVDATTRARPKRLVEAKTTNAYTHDDWGEEGSDQIPPEYVLQVQHYMAVTGLDVADVPVLMGGQRFRLYTVERDEKLIEALIEAEAAMWDRIERREPPEIDASDGAARYVKARFPVDDGTIRDADTFEEELARQYLEADAAIKELEAKKQLASNALKERMGETTKLVAAGVSVTWALTKGSVSWKGVADELAKDRTDELAAALEKHRGEGSRRFAITARGGA